MANELEKTITEETTAPSEPQKSPETSDKRVKELEAEIAKLKQAVTNASADASKWKKELQAKQTDEERAKAEQAEANAALQKEVEDLRTERNVANHKSQLLSIGFEDALAQETAQAINGGDAEKLFDGLRKFVASHDKAMAEKAMLNNPTLPGGDSTKTVTREEFDKMGYTEMVQFKSEHPDLYREYTK